MGISLPTIQHGEQDTVKRCEFALQKVRRDEQVREKRRLKMSRENNDPSLGPGMF
jgi:hypothetical protein